mmetsp:Transcript_78290/g.229434  ORF Transcript_78290/g.229434 Transcript_78290/m.229434 type:complete len:217 (+) Transcript_78290:25-675(+)
MQGERTAMAFTSGGYLPGRRSWRGSRRAERRCPFANFVSAVIVTVGTTWVLRQRKQWAPAWAVPDIGVIGVLHPWLLGCPRLSSAHRPRVLRRGGDCPGEALGRGLLPEEAAGPGPVRLTEDADAVLELVVVAVQRSGQIGGNVVIEDLTYTSEWPAVDLGLRLEFEICGDKGCALGVCHAAPAKPRGRPQLREVFLDGQALELRPGGGAALGGGA